jgi:hypothetical protein
MRLSAVLGAVLLLVVQAAFAASPAEDIVRLYGEAPGGVVLEGIARGFEDIKTLSYDKDKNEFVINEKARYPNPISRKDWVTLFRALKKDDLLGVSLIDGSPRVYGEMSKNSEMIQNLVATDRLLGGILYGMDELIGDVKLPGGYKPKKIEKRKNHVIAFTAFTNYEFQKNKEGKYFLADNSLNIQIIPLAKEKSPTGGHMPDEEALKNFVMEEADRENVNHLKTSQRDYFAMEPMGSTNHWGEAAAFARLVRETNIDHDDLLKQMR